MTLAVEGLEAGYGPVRIVRGVSFELRAGEIVALLGANGAGKTTTLGALSGTVRRFAGEVRLDGRPLRARPDATAAAGLVQVPQGRCVFADLTVRENLLAGTLGLRARAARAEVERVLGLLPRLAELEGRRGGLLSGGEQQLLAIGRALVRRPRALMVDELSLGLAPKAVAGFAPILRDLAAAGTAILMVEQYAAFAQRVADRVMVMADGAIAFAGDAGALGDAELLRASYLGAGAPRQDGGGATTSAPAA